MERVRGLGAGGAGGVAGAVCADLRVGGSCGGDTDTARVTFNGDDLDRFGGADLGGEGAGERLSRSASALPSSDLRSAEICCHFSTASLGSCSGREKLFWAIALKLALLASR